MASPAQITANRINAQLSTGPRTPEGKAAVAQNRTSHGFTGAFAVLPCEDRAAFETLLDDYRAEYHPCIPTEHFFVTELAQSQWQLMRADAIEAELLNPGDNPTYTNIAATFRDSDAIGRLQRYAQSARRAYYRAHEKLQSLRRNIARERREETQAPPPAIDRPVPIPPPVHLQRELDALRRRDPDFDPRLDASQMSKQLRKWFERHQPMAA